MLGIQAWKSWNNFKKPNWEWSKNKPHLYPTLKLLFTIVIPVSRCAKVLVSNSQYEASNKPLELYTY